MFGGKDKDGKLAPVEIMKYDENPDWVKIEISDQTAALPIVGMKSLSVEEKFYIVGGLDCPYLAIELNFSNRRNLWGWSQRDHIKGSDIRVEGGRPIEKIPESNAGTESEDG